jgi:hypothetical protein
MHLRSAFSTLALLAMVATANADVGESFAGNYLASRTAGRLRDNFAASDFLNAALSEDPKNPILIERLFQLQLASGDLTNAETSAAKVVAFNSQQRMARIVLGLKEFKARNYGAARDNFSEAAYTPVGELTSALLSAWSYAGEGSLNAALKELDKLDSQDSFASFKALHAALIADFLGSNVRADAAYKKAYQQSGTSLRVVQAYGNYLERNGNWPEAEKIYRGFLAGGQHNVLIEAALAKGEAAGKPKAFLASANAGVGERYSRWRQP